MQIIEFWNSIQNKEMTIYKLLNITEEIFTMENKISKLWEIISNLDYPNRDIQLIIYGKFLIEIWNNNFLGYPIIKQAISLLGKKKENDFL